MQEPIEKSRHIGTNRCGRLCRAAGESYADRNESDRGASDVGDDRHLMFESKSPAEAGEASRSRSAAAKG
jgi:hypothetical protein